jgi:hypothetical protein
MHLHRTCNMVPTRSALDSSGSSYPRSRSIITPTYDPDTGVALVAPKRQEIKLRSLTKISSTRTKLASVADGRIGKPRF